MGNSHKNSRTNTGPYTTIVLSNTDFLDWTEVCNSIFYKTKIQDTNKCTVKFKSIICVILKQDNLKIIFNLVTHLKN